MLEVDKIKLIDSYNKHRSIRKVGLELGISHETARIKLKAFGILNKPILYTCNDDLFSQDTPESFYWAGFIAADGCVKLHNKKYKRLSIALEQKDHIHVEKFKRTISFTGPVHVIERKDCTSSEICISSEKIFDDLARFNIVPRKSLILTFPEWLEKHELVNHFMRGYFDGDGSFYTSIGKNRTVKQLYFGLRGTKEFLMIYKNILERSCELKPNDKKPRANSGIFTLEYGGNQKVKTIRDFLYNNSINETRLDRKYNLAYME